MVRVVIARAASALLLGAAVFLAGCGNLVTTDLVGEVGISVDSDGKPVVMLAVCDDYVDQVQLSLGREGLKETEPSPVVGTWNASHRVTGLVRLDLISPDENWKSHLPVSLESTKHYIVNAWQKEADVEASQVDFFGRDLGKMEPGYVYTNTGDVDETKFVKHKDREFKKIACKQ